MINTEAIKRAILSVLGQRPGIRTRRELAQALRDLAAEQDRIADIVSEQNRRPAGERITPRSHGAGPGAPPGESVRWNGKQLLIGRSLWYKIGSPRSVSISFDGPYTLIRAADKDSGEYRVTVRPNQIPRVACRLAADVGQWAEGSRPGEIVGRSIKFINEAERP